MTLASTYQLSSSELMAGVLDLVVGVVLGVMVYRSSERFRAIAGVTPWRVPSWLWTVLVILFWWLVLLYLVARLTTRPRFPSGGPGGPGVGYGRPPWYGPPGYPGASGYPGAAGPWAPPGAPPGQPSPPPGPGQPEAPPYPGGPTPPPYPGGPTPPPYPGGAPAPTGWGPPGWNAPAPAPPVDPSGLPLPPNLGEGWYVDPTERFFLRYWDGTRWTDRVASGGRESTDPVTPGTGQSPPGS